MHLYCTEYFCNAKVAVLGEILSYSVDSHGLTICKNCGHVFNKLQSHFLVLKSWCHILAVLVFAVHPGLCTGTAGVRVVLLGAQSHPPQPRQGVNGHLGGWVCVALAPLSSSI